MMRAFQQIGRFREIVFALIRYGFDDVVERLDLPSRIKREVVEPRHLGDKGTYERIRMLMEDLGPTFVKIGQVLSLRPDLIPEELIEEFRKLQADVPPVEYKEIKRVLEECLKRPMEEVYSSFELEPMAAASLAQVHRAVLKETGKAVAVKVQRPEIRDRIETDLSILEDLAGALQDRLATLKIYDLPGIVEELKRLLMRELEFDREARNMKIVRGNMSSLEHVRIPEVHEEYCGDCVVTMELFQGRMLTDIDPGQIPNHRELGRLGLRASLKQILEDGFFHADPHPGNIVLLDDNTIGMLDWGMVGRLTQQARREFIDLISAIVDKDAELAVDIFFRLAETEYPLKRTVLEREVLDVMDLYHNAPLKDINIGRMMIDMTGVMRENGIRIPATFSVMVKAMLSAEGTAKQLSPELNILIEAEPIIRRMTAERFGPSSIFRGVRRMIKGLMDLQRHLPQRMERIFSKIDRGELTIRFRHENLEIISRTLDAATNRLAIALVIASLIMGSSMIMTTEVKPYLFGYPAIGVIGYLISGVLGLWLVVLFIKRRKF
jgi:ubiquinone biosynthesis protein